MTTNNTEYGYVKFTGDYSKLKSMGFTFQRLFAGNYMQWHRDHYRVWKKAAELEHDEYNLFKLITFLRTKPLMKKHIMHNGEESYSFYKMYYGTDHNPHAYNYHPYDEETTKKFRDYYQAVHQHIEDKKAGKPVGEFPEPLGDMVFIADKDLEVYREFDALGWIELDYFPEN